MVGTKGRKHLTMQRAVLATVMAFIDTSTSGRTTSANSVGCETSYASPCGTRHASHTRRSDILSCTSSRRVSCTLPRPSTTALTSRATISTRLCSSSPVLHSFLKARRDWPSIGATTKVVGHTPSFMRTTARSTFLVRSYCRSRWAFTLSFTSLIDTCMNSVASLNSSCISDTTLARCRISCRSKLVPSKKGCRRTHCIPSFAPSSKFATRLPGSGSSSLKRRSAAVSSTSRGHFPSALSLLRTALPLAMLCTSGSTMLSDSSLCQSVSPVHMWKSTAPKDQRS
mmetsp:Transcript_27007/g.86777  ORF Transcript_27007/g.86777 Transcript_27007/m.86777 type:complete len:284 (+) Transcript_27007:352-1203(+)